MIHYHKDGEDKLWKDPFVQLVMFGEQDFIHNENFIMLTMVLQFSNIAQLLYGGITIFYHY